MMSSSKDYFDWHYKISTFFLLIPPKNNNNWLLKVAYWALAVPHLVLICISPFLETAKLCLGGSGDFSSDVLNLGIAVLHFMGVNRVARWLFIKKDVDNVITRIRKINLEFLVFNYLNMQSKEKGEMGINPQRNPIEDYRIKKLNQTKTTCLKLYIGFVSYVAMNIIVSYNLNYFQLPTYEKWNPILNKTSTFRDYPYPLWYPFDTSISDGYYWLGFFYQPYAFFFLMSSFLCVDSLSINIVIHLTSHVNILGYALTLVDKNIDPVLDAKEAMHLRERRLIKCIKELQEIYKCAKTLDNIFSVQIMIQMICMAIILCCSVFRVTSVTLGPEVGYLSSMVAVCAMETFILSWFYQDFTLEIFELLHRLYELDWINYPPKSRKLLLFFMQRLQKPSYFTIGFWRPVDVGVFLATIKCSYSFYALITQSGSKLTKSITYGRAN